MFSLDDTEALAHIHIRIDRYLYICNEKLNQRCQSYLDWVGLNPSNPCGSLPQCIINRKTFMP